MASPTVSPAPKTPDQLNVYRVTYATRAQAGSAPVTSHAIVVAKSDFEAAAHVTRKSILHAKKVAKDSTGHELITSPEQQSIEVLTIRTVEQGAQVAGSSDPAPKAVAAPVCSKCGVPLVPPTPPVPTPAV